MNGGSAGVDPLGGAGNASLLQGAANLGRDASGGQIHPTTMVGAPSGAMMTDYGRQSVPNMAPSLSPASPPPAASPAQSPAPVGPSGPSWADIMQQQMMGGTPAIQGSLDVASKVNKASPQYKNALIGMLGGIF
jgi:hypothetical protein